MTDDPDRDDTASAGPRGEKPVVPASVERQSAEVELSRDDDLDVDDDSLLDPEDATAQDWAVADHARPDMTEETADGLDDTDEAVRRAAEDR